MMISFIDIHTHKHERQTNVLSIINLSQPVSDIPENIFFSSGWHPWYIENIPLLTIESSLRKIIPQRNLIAIGECGLDKSSTTQWQKQTDVFSIHLHLAKEYNKPLIIHCVKAWSDLLYLFKKENFKGKIILHGFNGNDQIVDKFLKFNTYFSFGKLLLNPESKLPCVLKNIPAERLFLETDEADYSISDIYLRTSAILDIPVDNLCEMIKNNFFELTGYGLVE
jgi:TatD DNase family protein